MAHFRNNPVLSLTSHWCNGPENTMRTALDSSGKLFFSYYCLFRRQTYSRKRPAVDWQNLVQKLNLRKPPRWHFLQPRNCGISIGETLKVVTLAQFVTWLSSPTIQIKLLVRSKGL